MTEILRLSLDMKNPPRIKVHTRNVERVDMNGIGGYAAMGSRAQRTWLSVTTNAGEISVATDYAAPRIDDDMPPFMLGISLETQSTTIRCALIFMPTTIGEYVPTELLDSGAIKVRNQSGIDNLSIFMVTSPDEVNHAPIVSWVDRELAQIDGKYYKDTPPRVYAYNGTYNAYKLAAVIILAAYAAADKVVNQHGTADSSVYTIVYSGSVEYKQVREKMTINGIKVTLPAGLKPGNVIMTGSDLAVASVYSSEVNNNMFLSHILDVVPNYNPSKRMKELLLNQAQVLRTIASTYEILAKMKEDKEQTKLDEQDDQDTKQIPF